MTPTDNEIVERLARPLRHPIDDQFGGIALREANRLLPVVKQLLLEARRDEHRAVCVGCDDIQPGGEGPFYCDQELAIERELAALKEGK